MRGIYLAAFRSVMLHFVLKLEKNTADFVKHNVCSSKMQAVVICEVVSIYELVLIIHGISIFYAVFFF